MTYARLEIDTCDFCVTKVVIGIIFAPYVRGPPMEGLTGPWSGPWVHGDVLVDDYDRAALSLYSGVRQTIIERVRDKHRHMS